MVGSTRFRKGKRKSKGKRKGAPKRPKSHGPLVSKIKGEKDVPKKDGIVWTEELKQIIQEDLFHELSQRKECIVTLKGEMEQGDDEEAAKEFIEFLQNVFGSDYAAGMFVEVHYLEKRKFKCMLSHLEIKKIYGSRQVKKVKDVTDEPSPFDLC